MEKPIELWCSNCGCKGYFANNFLNPEERKQKLDLLKAMQQKGQHTFPCPNPECQNEMGLS